LSSFRVWRFAITLEPHEIDELDILNVRKLGLVAGYHLLDQIEEQKVYNDSQDDDDRDPH
jgi:hypothetical protein